MEILQKNHEKMVLPAVLSPYWRIWWVQETQGKPVEDNPLAGLLNVQPSHLAWDVPANSWCIGISVGELGFILFSVGVAWDMMGMSLLFLKDLQLFQPVHSLPRTAHWPLNDYELLSPS